MRALTDLINQKETAWPDVQSWAADAKNAIEILPTTRPAGEQALLYIQVTTRSPMGAIALETGGIIVDDGFLRILGAGGPRMSSSLVNWNSRAPHLGIKGGLVIALDATGGVFALNDGSLPGARGHVAYFAPDTLEWEAVIGELNPCRSDSTGRDPGRLRRERANRAAVAYTSKRARGLASTRTPP